jgi:TetR/AcrR family transcriptional regulator, repressor of the ameABC operon
MARPMTDLEAGRAQLLELVEGLIKERGATSVTLTELASAAGMSPANIYRFFENKEALFEAAAERWFAPKIRIMEDVVESNLPVRQKLYDFFARRFVLMRDNCTEDPVLFKSYMELGEEHFETVRGYVDLGDHYLAMILSEAMEQGYFEGLSIDQAVSLVNLMIQPFCNPDLMMMLLHSVSEEKLGIVIDAILAGLTSKAATIESNVVVMGDRRNVA